MDQRYLNEYLASVNSDSSLTIDSKNLIMKHITGLFAFERRKKEEENKPTFKQYPEEKSVYENQPRPTGTGPLPQLASGPRVLPEGNISSGVQSPNSPTNRIG